MTIEPLPFLLWWLMGTALTLAARFFLVDQPDLKKRYGVQREPLTWGGLIFCAFAGLAGPVSGVFAVIWGICWLFDWLSISRKVPEFLRRPVFPPR